MPRGTLSVSFLAGRHELILDLHVTGLVGERHFSYPSELREGSCSTVEGETVYSFQPFQFETGASAHQVLVAPGAFQGIPSGLHFELSVVGFFPYGVVLCAGLDGRPGPVDLRPASAQEAAVGGRVVLALERLSRKMSVDVKVSGLQPGSAHAVQMVDGTCDNLGPVAGTVGQVRADAVGNAHLLTVIAGVAALPAGPRSVEVLKGPPQYPSYLIACGKVVRG